MKFSVPLDYEAAHEVSARLHTGRCAMPVGGSVGRRGISDSRTPQLIEVNARSAVEVALKGRLENLVDFREVENFHEAAHAVQQLDGREVNHHAAR
ncbi:hypothetical protein [Streptomyces sp. YIM S03343]